jgi:hypothetical protein
VFYIRQFQLHGAWFSVATLPGQLYLDGILDYCQPARLNCVNPAESHLSSIRFSEPSSSPNRLSPGS